MKKAASNRYRGNVDICFFFFALLDFARAFLVVLVLIGSSSYIRCARPSQCQQAWIPLPVS